MEWIIPKNLERYYIPMLNPCSYKNNGIFTLFGWFSVYLNVAILDFVAQMAWNHNCNGRIRFIMAKNMTKN